MWFIAQIIFWKWLGHFDDTTIVDYHMQLDVRKSPSWIKMLSKPNGIKLPDAYIWNLHINVDIMFDIAGCSLKTSQNEMSYVDTRDTQEHLRDLVIWGIGLGSGEW